MENFILDGVGFVSNVDFSLVVRAFLYVYLFFWIMVVIWVWFDASERSSNIIFKIFGVVVTLIFNVFGLLIYLLVRPTDSYEERYLSNLEKKYLQLETSGITQCPSCDFDLEPSFVVCPKCGESVKVKCDSCSEYIESYWEFCAYCGIKRDVPESIKEKYLSGDTPEEASSSKYHSSLDRCLFKVGEGKDRCIQKAREILDKRREKDLEERPNVSKKKKKKKKKKRK